MPKSDSMAGWRIEPFRFLHLSRLTLNPALPMVAKRKRLLEGGKTFADFLARDRVKIWEVVLRP